MIIPKLIHKASYLLIQLPEKFVKQLNQVLFTIIWGSKWEKIGRSQLCCSIEERGAKMIDVKQYLTASKFKWIFKIFNEKNFVADWKTIENICLKENLLFCVLRSNCKFSSMMMNSLVFLRFSRSTLKTLKCIIDILENIIPGTKFLCLNKIVKYRNKTVFYEEIFKAGIYDLYRLKRPNNELFSYDEITIIFGMTPNNQSFVKYIKLISALLLEWINNDYPTNGLHKFIEFKKKMLSQIELLGKSNKTAYTFLREKSKILPIKQQLKWCDILQILSESIDWKKVYENNYFSTIEAKLTFFQIRLNLRSLVMNVQLAGFGIIDSELCSFCLQQPETLIHFFFFECIFVECFWNNIGDWISEKLKVNIKLSKFNKLFGFQENCVDFKFLNNLMLVDRFFI